MVLSLLLVCAMLFNLSGCGGKISATNLMQGVTPRDVTIPTYSYSPDGAVTDFALRLFKESNQENQNTLISPLSVLYALAMTSNGAEGETLKQFEKVIGINDDFPEHLDDQFNEIGPQKGLGTHFPPGVLPVELIKKLVEFLCVGLDQMV